MKVLFGSALLLGLLIHTSPVEAGTTPKPAQAEAKTQLEKDERFVPLHAPGLPHFFRLTPELYSGGQPIGDQGFRELVKRGIKTIISVDGSKPDVARAKRFGLRYVHLPFGYDGCPETNALRLVKAARTLPGPIYIHCHHGQQRGPTGAAIICIGTAGWDNQVAVKWLHTVGTDPVYAGLYRTAAEFKQPTAAELASISTNFPAQVKLSKLVDRMVAIDHRWDDLKAAQEADYQVPKTNPDMDPPYEALLLMEQFREVQRSPEAKRKGDDFLAKAKAAEQAAAAVRRELSALAGRSPANHAAIASAYQKMNHACAACHRKYRNRDDGVALGAPNEGYK